MNCRDWEDRIALYAGGDLAAAEAQAVERHVAACAGCQSLLGGLRGSLETLRQAHGEPVDAAHYAAVRARVMGQLERGLDTRWRHAWVYAMVVAAVALTVAVWPRPPESLLAPMQVQVQPAEPVAHPAPHRMRPRKLAMKSPESAEPLVVKLYTNDPNVVIYWITGSKGE
jgi:hypothetical protein